MAGQRGPSGLALAGRSLGQPAAGSGAESSLRRASRHTSAPLFVCCSFDAGLPCFLGGTVQAPLGPMHFCRQDDRPKHVRDKMPEKGRSILHVIFACMK